MIVTRRQGLTCLVAACLLPRRALAQSEIDGALEDVARARARLKTLVGPFTQERKIGLLAAAVRSTGRLTLVRPDRLVWALQPPDDVTYWIGPEGLAYKSAHARGRLALGSGAPGAGDATSSRTARLAAALEDVRTLIGGDLARLRDRYELRLASARSADELLLEATPKVNGRGALQRILFGLDRERARPTRATLVEGPRDITEIVFGSLARDVPVPPAAARPPF